MNPERKNRVWAFHNRRDAETVRNERKAAWTSDISSVSWLPGHFVLAKWQYGDGGSKKRVYLCHDLQWRVSPECNWEQDA